MKAVQVAAPGGQFNVVDIPTPSPARNEVRIRVRSCGICHSDQLVKDGLFPGIAYPRVPGHEVIGVVDSVGGEVTQFKAGDTVGVGWHGGHCFECDACRRGDFVVCENQKICGISYDGGYAEYMVAPQEALVRVPPDLNSIEAAPLLCAGITTFNALRNSGARAGDCVAVLGIGGLGHLAVQYARRMGFYTIALSRGAEKKSLAFELGAHGYIDTKVEDSVSALQAAGGARVILATAPNAQAIGAVQGGLRRDGRLIVVGVDSDSIQVNPLGLIAARRGIYGWPSGTAIDSEDTLQFSARFGVKPRTEVFALGQVQEAYERMLQNQARFRVVLKING